MEKTWKNISFILAGALAATLLYSLPKALSPNAFAQRGAPNQATLQTANDLSNAFRQVADALRPSVVSINAIQSQPRGRRQRGGDLQGLPRGLFDGLPPELFEDGFRIIPQQQRGESSGIGSGVIIRADGYILTNNHVVEGSDQLEVELADRRRVPAKIVGTDPETDLAVIKIDAPNLEPAPLGDSDATRVGDWVLAVGSPFGLEQTVTAGIISAKNRVQGIVRDGDGYEDFLQTDAAINPGNSGGPLVNLKGEVIGINTAIASRSGGYNGIGFTIPMSLARPVLTSLIESGSVRRGFLGAQLGPVTEETKENLGLTSLAGAYIQKVLDGQPAAQGGLQSGDVVLEVNGRGVRDLVQFRNTVAATKPGGALDVKVNRKGRLVDLRITVGEKTDEALARFNQGTLWGADLVSVTESVARKNGLRQIGGMLVTGVEEDSRAERSGLEPGDVIIGIADQAVSRLVELRVISERLEEAGEPIRLVIRRGTRRGLLTIE